MSKSEEWRHGWKVVVASSLGVLLMAAPSYSLGPFILPLQNEFGWNRAQLAGTMSVFTTVVAFAISFVGYAVDRVGARKIALAGVILTSVALGSLALTSNSLVLYYVNWAIIGLGTTLCSYVVWTRAIIGYFSESRGAAIAIAFCGTSLSGVCAPLVATSLIEHFGWRVAYVSFSTGLLILVFPVVWVFFHESRTAVASAPALDPKQNAASSGPTLRYAVRSITFWMLAISFFMAGGAIVAIAVHMMPLLQGLGISPMRAAGALSIMSAGSLVGRLGMGYFLDRTHPLPLAAIALAFPIAACVIILAAPQNIALLYVAAGAFGIATGAIPTFIPFVVVYCFGLTHYGTIYGFLHAAFSVGATTFAPLLGWLYEREGSYHTASLVLAGAYVVSGIALMCLGRYRKPVSPG